MKTTNTARGERFLGSLAASDIETALNCLHPDVVFDEMHEMHASGRYVGHDGFITMVTTVFGRLTAEVNSVESFSAADTVIGRTGLTFTSKATGRKVRTTLVVFYTFADDLIIHADVYYKDPAAVKALAEERSS